MSPDDDTLASLQRKTTRATFATRLFVVVAIVVTVAVLALLVTLAAQNRDLNRSSKTLVEDIEEQQNRDKLLLQATERAADRIEDCSTPTGVCFEEEQVRVAGFIGDLRRYIVVANACSISGVESLRQIDRCVTRRTTEEGGR